MALVFITPAIIVMDKLRNKIIAAGFLFNPDGSVYRPNIPGIVGNWFMPTTESFARELDYATLIPRIHPRRLKFCDEKKMMSEFGTTITVIGFCGIARDTCPFGFVLRHGTIDFSTFQDAVLEASVTGILRYGDVLVLDNKAIHRHKDASILEDVLYENGISVLFMPTHSPELNPMKNIWKMLEARMKHLGFGGMMSDLSNTRIASMIMLGFTHGDVDVCYHSAGYI